MITYETLTKCFRHNEITSEAFFTLQPTFNELKRPDVLIQNY